MEEDDDDQGVYDLSCSFCGKDLNTQSNSDEEEVCPDCVRVIKIAKALMQIIKGQGGPIDGGLPKV